MVAKARWCSPVSDGRRGTSIQQAKKLRPTGRPAAVDWPAGLLHNRAPFFGAASLVSSLAFLLPPSICLVSPRTHLPMPRIDLHHFQPGDEAALHAVFHASVHGLTSRHYSRAQCEAWSPLQHDPAQWAERMQANRPFIARGAGSAAVAGFADLQADGYIDQFFVAPAFAGQGVARALMAHLHAQAAQRGLARMWAHVSLTAEAFFAAQGFVVQERREVERAGVVLRNALMQKILLVA
jgi:putative acetyltransferase